MKTLIISDVHSNIYALEAIWKQERDCERIYCNGDLVDYGPYPKEALNWIRSHDVLCTQGNHDRGVVACYRSGAMLESVPTEDRKWVNHNASLLDEQDIDYLDRLPRTMTFDRDEIPYAMTHQCQDYQEIVSLHTYALFLDSITGQEKSCVTRLILGHTHRQAVRYLSDELLWLNPGSVSYRRPDDPDTTAHYAVITDCVISLKRLSYDLSPLQKYVAQVSLRESEISVAKRCFGLSD